VSPSPCAGSAGLAGADRGQAQTWSQYQQEQLHTRDVNRVFGRARFLDPYHLQVEQTDKEPQTLAFNQTIVATGSEPVFLPQLKPDGRGC
jgi:pyruvate/2-oxoglutarate dehydrogenase complex dihydrolipoamide dehydrogenase (E3) component